MSERFSRCHYEFLDDIATADIAFRAVGESLESLFEAAARATTAVMVNPASVRSCQTLSVKLESDTLEALFFRWIEELIFQKDANALVFNEFHFSIDQKGKWILTGTMKGEEISPERHGIRCDVKGVTLHLFELKQGPEGWEARVVLDV